jgi:hypothetical protein
MSGLPIATAMSSPMPAGMVKTIAQAMHIRRADSDPCALTRTGSPQCGQAAALALIDW